MKRIFSFLMLIFSFVLLLTGCGAINLYEKNTAIPNYEWKAGFDVKGSFDITDTTNPNKIYVVLRHTDAYKYNNIWLNVGLQKPGDTMTYQKVDIPLGSDATGWYGTGMNDIWEIRHELNAVAYPFIKKGLYQFSIQQIMRDDPLLHVMSAGMRIERMVR
jgi:gliding motility-associated lipoprotein GldH